MAETSSSTTDGGPAGRLALLRRMPRVFVKDRHPSGCYPRPRSFSAEEISCRTTATVQAWSSPEGGGRMMPSVKDLTPEHVCAPSAGIATPPDETRTARDAIATPASVSAVSATPAEPANDESTVPTCWQDAT